MTNKKKEIQKILAACMICTQIAGCRSSSMLENSGESALTSSQADPLEETQIVELGNIQIQIPADWEKQNGRSEENLLVYSGENNDIPMEVTIEYTEGGNTGDISEEEREEGIAYLNQLMAEYDENTDDGIFIDADIWEIGPEGQMIAEFNFSIDDDSGSWARNCNMFSINYGKDNYIISFLSGECESADMDFWEEIIRNISYEELDDEIPAKSDVGFDDEDSAASETIEESVPTVIAVEPDPDEVEEETSKTENIESNPTESTPATTTESAKDNESSEWSPEYTIGSIYYKPGKFAFVITDVLSNEYFEPGVGPDYVGFYSFIYIYIDYTKPEEISEEDVQFEQVLNTNHPDIPYVQSNELSAEYANNFYSTVPREPESFHVGIKNMDIHSAEGAIEMNVTFTKFDETVTFYLPQDYS